MASTKKTEQFGLNLWEPEDHFLRADFNADNRALDAALAALDRRTAGVEGALPLVSYHVYNLMLQNYYEGKETGYKRALLFDGFLDDLPGAAYSPGMFRKAAAPELILDALGQGNYSQDYGSVSSRMFSGNGSYQSGSAAFTTKGGGLLTGVTFRREGGTGIRVELRKGGVVLQEVLADGVSALGDYTTPFHVMLEAETAYELRVYSQSPTFGVTFYSARGSGNWALGFKLVCTPTKNASGTLTLPARDLGGDYDRALAWVRHAGGSASLEIKGPNGAWRTLEKGAARQTVNLQGQSCTETAFSLVDVPPAPNCNTALRLGLSAVSGESVNPRVYDYGVMFL